MTIKNGSTYFKYSVILIGVIFLFLLFRKCGDGNSTPTKSDTIKVDHEVIIDRVVVDTQYVPQERKIIAYKTEYKTDTIETLIYQRVDSAAILRELLATRYYLDTIPNQYGSIIIADTVTKNKIAGRGVKTNLDIPIIRETVTLAQPKRGLLYVNFEAMGGEQDFLFATGAGLSYKSRNDKIYGLKAFLTKTGNPMYGFQFSIPIKTRK